MNHRMGMCVGRTAPDGVPLLRQVGDRWGESITCYNMGMIYKALGDLAEAERLLTRTVELDEAIGHPDLESDRAALQQVRSMIQSGGGGASSPGTNEE
jgi:hypothetical protein